jgi:hypothetical protein
MTNKRYIYISHPCVSGDCCFKGAKIAFATSRLIKSLKTVCYAQSLYESVYPSGAHDHLWHIKMVKVPALLDGLWCLMPLSTIFQL